MIRKHMKLIAFVLAISLVSVPVISNFHSFTNIIEASVGDHTGLKMYWTDITNKDGENFGWPRKTYFTGGNGEYRKMGNMYTYCVANHTGQAEMGSETGKPLENSKWDILEAFDSEQDGMDSILITYKLFDASQLKEYNILIEIYYTLKERGRV